MAYQLKFANAVYKRPGLGLLLIDRSVGFGRGGKPGVNRPDDVMLVQWLLSRTLGAKDYLGPPIEVNGVYSPQTDHLLCRFLLDHCDHRLKGGSPLRRLDTLLLPPTGLPGNWGEHTIEACMADLGEIDARELYEGHIENTMPFLLRTAILKNTWTVPKDGPKVNPFPP
jgi:hypothetical protein